MNTFDSDDELSFVPPDHFVCPITFEVMRDPVICADGITYERSEITKWLEKHNTSPKTKDVLPSRAMIPNLAIKSAIEKMKEEHPDWDALDKGNAAMKEDKTVSSKAIKIFIKTLGRQTWTLAVNKDDSVAKVKEKLYALEGIKANQMRLIYSGKLMDENRSLMDYGVGNHSTLHMVVRCLGG